MIPLFFFLFFYSRGLVLEKTFKAALKDTRLEARVIATLPADFFYSWGKADFSGWQTPPTESHARRRGRHIQKKKDILSADIWHKAPFRSFISPPNAASHLVLIEATLPSWIHTRRREAGVYSGAPEVCNLLVCLALFFSLSPFHCDPKAHNHNNHSCWALN